MMDSGNCNGGSLDVDTRSHQLLDGTKRTTSEFFCNCVGACGIFIDYADEFNGIEFAGKLVIDAGMVASECAYTDDGNGNGIV
jgi:hypothetical protein